jgi:hypothetical protein
MYKYSPASPYGTTPTANQYFKYLDYWQPPALSSSSSDVIVTISSKYTHRPDLLSYDYYGTAKLWWVFAVFNANIIKDPIYDLVAGITIVIPNKDHLPGIS